MENNKIRKTSEDKPHRIIFQPTEEANKKIEKLLSTNANVSLTQLMNLIIMDIPDNTKITMKLDKGDLE